MIALGYRRRGRSRGSKKKYIILNGPLSYIDSQNHVEMSVTKIVRFLGSSIYGK